ncbi:MAG: Protein of unknown function (DUF4435) [Phormidium sp. OSCR]|nr:MAG: Protein of unknown function (DUF4435) [Phormidium sp. OSCR]
MRENITVDRDVNAIRFRRQTFSGVFLLVEGTSDEKVYQNFIDAEKCQLISYSQRKPSNKTRIIQILDRLSENSFQGAIAIVDADFDRIQNVNHNNSNIFTTDTHDLETMILDSPALEKVVFEFGSVEKIEKFSHKKNIRVAILEGALLIGCLRLISQSYKLNLTFEDITFSKFTDKSTLVVDSEKLIKTVKDKSKAFELKSEYLMQLLEEENSNCYDPWQVCCGHDMVEILSIGLNKAIGSEKKSDVEPLKIERSLRLAYEIRYFRKTQLYSSIRFWEREHQEFTVFPEDP